MAENQNEGMSSIEEDSQAKIVYWMKKLDLKSSHMQASSKLVYLVDGAVLAFVYFLFGKVGDARPAVFCISFIFLVLGVINYLHAEFIRHINNEFWNINAKLLELTGEESEHTWPSGHFVIKRDHYRLIHLVISFAILVVFIILLLYGLGCFPDRVLGGKTS